MLIINAEEALAALFRHTVGVLLLEILHHLLEAFLVHISQGTLTRFLAVLVAHHQFPQIFLLALRHVGGWGKERGSMQPMRASRRKLILSERTILVSVAGFREHGA